MTDEEECIHMIWPSSSCVVCNPPKPISKQTWEGIKTKLNKPTFQPLGGTPVIAEFDGWCGQCGGRIEKDLDEIVMYRGEWVHADCAHGEG